MTEKEIFEQIYRKHHNSCGLHKYHFHLTPYYSDQQHKEDALTLAYFEVRDYRYNEPELVQYARNVFLNYFSITTD